MRAAALYRVSTKKQVKTEEDSIPVQQHLLREYAAERGWELVAEYIEPGVSAYKLSSIDRDILQDALREAEAGKYDVLLVFKADRLSRNSFEYPMVLWRLYRAGVEVIAVADAPGGRKLNVDDQMEKLLRFIEGWQAETESKNTSIRVSQAMLDLARQGKWSGGRPPYGFRLSSRKNGLPLEIDLVEADVLKEMVRLYLEEGVGSKKIAEILNSRGLRTREGKLWRDGRVRDVLQNPIIAGLPAYNRTRPGNTPTSRCRVKDRYDLNNPEIIIPRDEDGNPRPIEEYVIIPLETWLKVMQKMKASARNEEPDARALDGPALLTGFLKCGYCGRGFISSRSNRAKITKPNGKTYIYERAYYRCITHARIGKEFCPGQGSYSQRKIDTIFLNELRMFLSNLDLGNLEAYIDSRQQLTVMRLNKEIRHLEAELEKAKRRLKNWVERLNQYFSDPAGSLYSEELMAAEIKRAQEEIADLEKKVAATRAELRACTYEREKLQEFARLAPRWFDIFITAPVPVQKRMLAQIIDKVTLWKDRLEISYRVDLTEFARLAGGEGEGTVELRVAVSL
ncbi:recombinase family protein [Thermanaeromonas sp. C210]|uniref:recombinase family protein n=1 Tax=Thermanaeromonas sp. C210 TaxID=2731925 RepID=UPI00155B8813|nr:recombinase family protein [Thermanaeromonas sp. C210]GFN23796.1 serine recombinase [Thermanaeromonas sp. C210]